MMSLINPVIRQNLVVRDPEAEEALRERLRLLSSLECPR